MGLAWSSITFETMNKRDGGVALFQSDQFTASDFFFSQF